MDARPTPPPPSGESGLPAVRPPSPVVRPGDARPGVPPPETSGTPEAPETPAHRWRRLTRTRRGAAGLAILAAALLLWPFAGWFWIPWLAGLVVLVLVALLRLDRLLHGWSWHLGGLAVLVGLMLNTGPWDWALAASLGVLLAGLVQLPWWRLAAVGAVLCLLAGVGLGVRSLSGSAGKGGAGSADLAAESWPARSGAAQPRSPGGSQLGRARRRRAGLRQALLGAGAGAFRRLHRGAGLRRCGACARGTGRRPGGVRARTSPQQPGRRRADRRRVPSAVDGGGHAGAAARGVDGRAGRCRDDLRGDGIPRLFDVTLSCRTLLFDPATFAQLMDFPRCNSTVRLIRRRRPVEGWFAAVNSP